MDSRMHSEQWHHISNLKPVLASSVKWHRQLHRGKTRYLLQDSISGKHHCIDARTFSLIGRFDGLQTVADIWELLKEADQESAPSQDEVVHFFTQLKKADLIQTGEINPAQLYAERNQQQSKGKFKQHLNPLALRFPLLNPSQLLDRIAPLTQWLFSPLAITAWFVAMVMAVYLAVTYWQPLMLQGSLQLYSPDFWLLSACAYPVMKAIHELSHAVAIRRFGGEVNEMGISLLVLMPLPYVNASAATGFPDKWQRILVGAAGIMSELALSAIALVIWLSVADGLVRDMAFAVITLGGVSTLLFNGNPLLKFDGYHMFSDWLEIPNLTSKCVQHWSYLAKRFVAGIPELHAVAHDKRETFWLTAYGPSAFLYRMGLTLTLATLFADVSLWISAAVVSLMLTGLIFKPLYRVLRYMSVSHELRRYRVRAWATLVVILPLCVLLFTAVPLPHNTLIRAVTWLPDNSKIRAGSNGFIREYLKDNQSMVSADDIIMRLENPLLEAKLASANARKAAIQAEHNASISENAQKTRQLDKRLKTINIEVAELLAQIESLQIRAPSDGLVYIPDEEDRLNSWSGKGDVLAYLLSGEQLELRSAVSQQDAHLLRLPTASVDVIFSNRPEDTWPAQLALSAPSSSQTLPSAALSQQLGGSIPTEAGDIEHTKTTEPVFIVNLIVSGLQPELFGARAWVRINHGHTTLMDRWSLRWKQLFMQHVSARG